MLSSSLRRGSLLAASVARTLFSASPLFTRPLSTLALPVPSPLVAMRLRAPQSSSSSSSQPEEGKPDAHTGPFGKTEDAPRPSPAPAPAAAKPAATGTEEQAHSSPPQATGEPEPEPGEPDKDKHSKASDAKNTTDGKPKQASNLFDVEGESNSKFCWRAALFYLAPALPPPSLGLLYVSPLGVCQAIVTLFLLRCQ
jgi:hypothetical protein